MTNKFPIGSQWKTRAGHRAVVVDYFNNGAGENVITIWIGGGVYARDEVVGLFPNGMFLKTCDQHGYDLLTPWQEPRKGTFWVVVHPGGAGECFQNEGTAIAVAREVGALNCIKLDWQEKEAE